MLRSKLKSASDMIRSEGVTGFVSFLRRRAARRLMGNTLQSFFPVMAQYRHADGESIRLYAGYRDYLKPLHFLAHTDLAGYQLFLRDNAQAHILAAGLGGAWQFHSFITAELGIDVRGKKILDIGCGDGALAYVLAARGATEVHGIDIEFSHLHINPFHSDLLKEGINRAGEASPRYENRVRIYSLDVQEASIEDRFDIIVSNSVLEHIVDLRAALGVMRDLLKPGGVMVHRFNPFFSETGGHEYCVLDFPWGHVRLSPAEIVEYFATYRGWEKEQAATAFSQRFNDPKLTLADIDSFAASLRLRTRLATERRALSWKLDSEPGRILTQGRRQYPLLAWRDLLADTVTRVWSQS